jgi:hypothetical protein
MEAAGIDREHGTALATELDNAVGARSGPACGMLARCAASKFSPGRVESITQCVQYIIIFS